MRVSVHDVTFVHRRALLDRLTRARPKIVALVAPAGFGKSVLVQQYFDACDGGAVCDLRGLRDDHDLARRVVHALAQEDAARADDVARLDGVLSDGARTLAERLNAIADAWSVPVDATFAFENIDTTLQHAATREF